MTGSTVQVIFARISAHMLLAALCLPGMMSGVHAQVVQRPFPGDALLGVLSPSANPVIVIDGLRRQLAAGAQIRNENNMIVQPMALSGGDVRIIYKKNRQAQIERIWILNVTEAQKITTAIPASMLYTGPATVVVTPEKR